MKEVLNLYNVLDVYNYDNWEEEFANRYVELFSKYDYIVGDQSAGMLRLAGFNSANFEQNLKKHLKNTCAYQAPYFVLEKIVKE